MRLGWFFCRFTVVQKHMVEFSQIALANSNGSDDMLNRVMTKDNVGVAVLLEVNKEMFTGGKERCIVDDFLLWWLNIDAHGEVLGDVSVFLAGRCWIQNESVYEVMLYMLHNFHVMLVF